MNSLNIDKNGRTTYAGELLNLARIAVKSKQTEVAAALFKRAEEERAFFDEDDCLDYGEVCRQISDPSGMVKAYELADGKSDECLSRLFECYLYGTGTEINFQRAEHCLNELSKNKTTAVQYEVSSRRKLLEEQKRKNPPKESDNSPTQTNQSGVNAEKRTVPPTASPNPAKPAPSAAATSTSAAVSAQQKNTKPAAPQKPKKKKHTGMIIFLFFVLVGLGGLYRAYKLWEEEQKAAAAKKAEQEEAVVEEEVYVYSVPGFQIVTGNEAVPSDELRITPGNVETSSALVGKYEVYGPEYLFDGDIGTPWQEGEEGDGTGSTIQIFFDSAEPIRTMTIWPGKQKSEKAYYDNNRPQQMTILFSNGADSAAASITLDDVIDSTSLRFDEDILADSVTITIDSVYPGSVYNDTNISELAFYYAE